MRKAMFKLFGIAILAGSLGGGWLLMDYREFTVAPLSVKAEGQLYEVRPGAGLKRVARELEEQSVIYSARYLVWMARLDGTADSIKAGEYRLSPGMTPASLMRAMSVGDTVHYALTLVEGWNFQQVMSAVKSHPQLMHTLESTAPDQVMTVLGYPGEHPEGRFFPDTYHFPRGTRDVDFLQRAHQAMERALAEEWAERDADLPLETPYTALILASIVEKETGLPEERPAIAGVFVRRLQRGMRLQTDPTVIYGIGASFDGNLRRRDLDQDSPYNTYRRSGLPPTPIANPGRAAIHAALHPEPGDTLFFVSRGDGSHVFSATLAEHNDAVERYQLNGGKKTAASTRIDSSSQSK